MAIYKGCVNGGLKDITVTMVSGSVYNDPITIINQCTITNSRKKLTFNLSESADADLVVNYSYLYTIRINGILQVNNQTVVTKVVIPANMITYTIDVVVVSSQDCQSYDDIGNGDDPIRVT